MTIKQFIAKKKNELLKEIEKTVTFYLEKNVPMYELNLKVDLITHKHFERPSRELKQCAYIYSKALYRYNYEKKERLGCEERFLEYSIDDLNYFIEEYEPTKKEIKQAKKMLF